MRCIALLLLLVIPAHAAEICVQSAVSWCCHPNCDLPYDTMASGYTTSGTPTCGQYGELTISSSATDPTENQGELPSLGNLYLWATAADSYGFSASEVTVVGDLPLWEFNALHPSVTIDPDTPLFATTWSFSVGCLYSGPTLLANLVVLNPPTSVEPSSWARLKVLWR